MMVPPLIIIISALAVMAYFKYIRNTTYKIYKQMDCTGVFHYSLEESADTNVYSKFCIYAQKQNTVPSLHKHGDYICTYNEEDAIELARLYHQYLENTKRKVVKTIKSNDILDLQLIKDAHA